MDLDSPGSRWREYRRRYSNCAPLCPLSKSVPPIAIIERTSNRRSVIGDSERHRECEIHGEASGKRKERFAARAALDSRRIVSHANCTTRKTAAAGNSPRGSFRACGFFMLPPSPPPTPPPPLSSRETSENLYATQRAKFSLDSAFIIATRRP
jgi:hypothetical protein